MIILWILLAILLILFCLVGVAVVRTLRMKPTEAATAQFPDSDMERAQKYAESLSRMIQCETISFFGQTDLTKYHEFHKLLETEFPTLHAVATRTELDGSLLYKISGTNATKKPIMLMSHHDVVSAEGEWVYPPFSGQIAEGAVWGRGTVDTKGNLFCMMQAVEELLNAGWKPESDVYIASSRTEEWAGGGAPATAAYLKEHGVHLGMLLDEGGAIMNSPIAGVNGSYGLVGVVEKGYADVKFTARSNGGHASAPPKNTPLVRLGKLMTKIEKRSPFTTRMTPALREMFTRMAPNMSFPMRLLMGNMWLFEPLLVLAVPRINSLAGAMMRTTCAFTTAKGSNGLNVIPSEAFVTANMRCMPFQPTHESIKIIEKIAAKFDLETEVLYANEPPTSVSYESSAFKLLEETMQKVYPGYGMSPYIMTGCTDCRFYTEVTDNALRFAPIQITAEQQGNIHGLNENVSVLALPPAVDFFHELLVAWAGETMEA